MVAKDVNLLFVGKISKIDKFKTVLQKDIKIIDEQWLYDSIAKDKCLNSIIMQLRILIMISDIENYDSNSENYDRDSENDNSTCDTYAKIDNNCVYANDAANSEHRIHDIKNVAITKILIIIVLKSFAQIFKSFFTSI